MPKGQAVSFDDELAAVSRLRGLAPKGSISGLRVTRDELLAHVERSVELERPPESLQGTEAMLVGLGAVPADFDFHATLLRLLSESLAGLYEPRLKTMMVRDGLGAMEAKVTLLHELVHALQDQRFNLREVVEFHEDDSDVSSAISSLAEGDATSAMMDGILPEGQTALSIPEDLIEQQFFSQAPKEDAPPIVVRSLFAPYVDGLRFVHALRRRGGWKEVDLAWQTLPRSTEQILHLDKFDSREPPLSVDVPSAPSDEWELILHDIWGEQSLRLLLEEWVEPKVAEQAAAGWGGDRIAAYRLDKELTVIWDVKMDTEADAQELFAAAARAVDVPSSTGTAIRCGTVKNKKVHLQIERTADVVSFWGLPFDRTAQRSRGCPPR